MNDLMLSVRMALAAVFHPEPEVWDFLWELNKESTCVERDMTILGRDFCQNQHEFIKCWGEMDDEMMDRLGTGFSEEEWQALTAKRAWQKGRRVPEVFRLLKYLEDQISKQCDLYESGIYSGLLGDCNLGRWAEMKKEAALH